VQDPAVTTSIADAYDSLVRRGAIERDPAQVALVARLDGLAAELGEYRLARKSSALGWLFGKARKSAFVRGVYIWGSVGRGKSMLMDLFFEAVNARNKRRVHFHAFMHDVHGRIHEWRQLKKSGSVKGEDPIAPVADALAKDAWLLCFDEFAVSDIADAMILGRLFTALFERGVVVIATSNVEPSRLYEGGLNRALFLPFISLLRERVEIVELQSRTDFRMEKLSGAPVYVVPHDEAAQAALQKIFESIGGASQGKVETLKFLGRELNVREAAGGVARFTFSELCEKPLAAADYLAIAERYHTVIIENIPVMQIQHRNEAKRFINLIDTLYDQRVKVVASAQAEPHELYQACEGREAFEFDRTVSRLIEMRSHDYLALPHGAADSKASGNTAGLVET